MVMMSDIGMANLNTTSTAAKKPTTFTPAIGSSSGTSYASQVLPASTNEQKWTTGKNPKLKPGQMIFDKGNYYWVGSDGKVQKTADINTAYSTAGFKAGDKAADVVQAANQKFNLGGGQIQYDNKTGAYYFKDPASGKVLTTTDLSTAYGVVNPKNNPYAPKDPTTGLPAQDPGAVSATNPYGMHSRTETYASGMRPDSKGEQFFQPVYQQQYKDYAQPGYSLMGNQAGLGAMTAMQGQNTAGNLGALPGIGQTRNPFSITPSTYAQQFQPQQNFYGQGMYSGMGQMQSPFSSYAQPQQQFQPQQQQYQPQQQGFYGQGMQGGMGRTATPFGASGSTGAFGGGFGGAGLYGKK